MSIEQVPAFIVRCDSCRRLLTICEPAPKTAGWASALFHSKETAQDHTELVQWETKAQRHTCRQCLQRPPRTQRRH